MELFPAQPDLSLQISPPSIKQAPPAWRGNTREEEVDLGFWKRAFDQSSRSSKEELTTWSNSSELALSNSNVSRVSLFHLHQDPNPKTSYHHHHHQQDHPHKDNNLFQVHSLQQNPLSSAASQQEFITGREINSIFRPIKGIPIYNQNSSNFPLFHHCPRNLLADSPATLASSYSSALNSVPGHSGFQSHHHQRGLMRSRFLSRFPAKRRMRAPRMRWTTTLHARFVHAVELLGGHESKPYFRSFFFLISSVSDSHCTHLLHLQ